jgi:hypothetical protein
MLLRLGDLEDAFKIDDKAGKTVGPDLEKLIAVVFVVLQDRKATRIVRASHRALKGGSPVVALYLVRSWSVTSSAKYEIGMFWS